MTTIYEPWKMMIDPDNNFLCITEDNCCFDTEGQYYQTIKTVNRLSMIHFSCRSRNLNDIKEYWSQFTRAFNIAAMCESWINPIKGRNFVLDRYKFSDINEDDEEWLYLYCVYIYIYICLFMDSWKCVFKMFEIKISINQFKVPYQKALLQYNNACDLSYITYSKDILSNDSMAYCQILYIKILK